MTCKNISGKGNKRKVYCNNAFVRVAVRNALSCRRIGSELEEQEVQILCQRQPAQLSGYGWRLCLLEKGG